MDEYPGNSHKLIKGRVASPQDPQTKSIKKITKGSIVQRRKPLLARIFGEHIQSIGSYVLWDVLIPAAKNTVTEIISNGIEMLMYGEPRSNLKRNRDRSYVSYTGYYGKDRDRDRNRERSKPINRNRHRFDDLVMDSRADAEEVLSGLADLIEDAGVATVGDFYDMVGLTAEWSDNKYGWDNLSRAAVKRVREGYILEMPKPLALD